MSLLPDHYLDAVVSLETRGEEADFRPLGSGFLVGARLPGYETADIDEARHDIYLVTSAHVIEGEEVLYAKLNVTGSSSDITGQRFELTQFDEDGSSMWATRDDFDIAVTLLAPEVLKETGARFNWIPEHKWLYTSDMEAANVGPGDEVFVCGFPLGLSGSERKYVIVRSGCVARLDEEIIGETGSFLIDCSIFPGNSGGPVLLKPRLMEDDDGSVVYEMPFLLGVVKSYLPYRDTAVSLQTGQPRITFEENSGLAAVVPADAITAAIELARTEGLSETGEGDSGWELPPRKPESPPSPPTSG
jgi:hypothetical protein